MTLFLRCSTLQAAAAFLALTFGAAIAQAQTPPDGTMQKNITVSATGTVDATPDLARIQTGIITEAETAAQALSGNSQNMAKLIGGLKESAIEAKDIQTSSFRVEPRYTNPRDGQAPEINGYRVVNEVQVVVRDITKLGAILDALVKLGANQMNGLSFDVSKAETLKDDARKQAIENALRRAKLLAAAAGAEVGDVIAISEDVSHGGPRPFAMARAAKADMVPIEGGSETLEARVTVTWALK
ncbi:MAG: SIMPL domain-containing protein [Hyphomicrobiaceae bacterium]|nr:SIMPL domain-containing protein [Hyphomicrobiaceae bacterium]